MGFREYTIASGAVAKARALGLRGEVSLRVARMARRSAPCTHDKGNRRFNEFVLKVENGIVLDVVRL